MWGGQRMEGNQEDCLAALLIRLWMMKLSLAVMVRKLMAAVWDSTRAMRASRKMGCSGTRMERWPVIQISSGRSKVARIPDSLMSMDRPLTLPSAQAKTTGMVRGILAARGMRILDAGAGPPLMTTAMACCLSCSGLSFIGP